MPPFDMLALEHLEIPCAFSHADPPDASAALCLGAEPSQPPSPQPSFLPVLCLQINCVTFPHPDTMPEQQLLKPTEWSYCDYFWVSGASVSPTLWPQGPRMNPRGGA